jgi:hypothetical protein
LFIVLVAGYVPMSASVDLRSIVNPFFLRGYTQTKKTEQTLDKRIQKKLSKPGFN